MAAASGGGREKAQFTGELTKTAVRRVQWDLCSFQKEPMYEDGIFVLSTDQLHVCKALIIGPMETPYQYGFYMFDIKYPNTYPWDPPQVTFVTGDKRVRLNPNLYVGGKVCLSILGTWSGPPWTPSLTLRTVLLSIQSLLHSHPLQNEPAFAKVTGERDQRYSRILFYENIIVAVLRMLEYTPPGFEVFRPHMGYYFLRGLEEHKAVLNRLRPMQGHEEESPLGSFKTTYDPAACLGKIEEWERTLHGDTELMQRVRELEAAVLASVPDAPVVVDRSAKRAPSSSSATTRDATSVGGASHEALRPPICLAVPMAGVVSGGATSSTAPPVPPPLAAPQGPVPAASAWWPAPGGSKAPGGGDASASSAASNSPPSPLTPAQPPPSPPPPPGGSPRPPRPPPPLGGVPIPASSVSATAGPGATAAAAGDGHSASPNPATGGAVGITKEASSSSGAFGALRLLCRCFSTSNQGRDAN